MATPGNINLSINATSNLGNTTAALEAMRRGMAAVRAETEKYYKQVQTTGREDRLGFQKANNSVDMLRDGYKDIIQQSGLYAQSTKNITAETTRFNEQLSRQKVRLRDVVGNTRMVRDAMKEQMALNRMMVTGWRKDATGSIKADMWVPTDVSLKNMGAMRAELGYYNQILRSISLETVNWGKNTQWAGRQLTVGFSVPISIAAGLLGKLGASADSELVRITKVYGDTESAFQASNESLRNMAQDTARYIADQYGIAASDTRKVMAELAATGMEGAELQAMTGSVQRLSLLGEMSAEDSLKLARVLKEVYGLSAQELDKQVDYFNAIENSTALTMQDITEGVPRIAGMMEATGTSIEEQTALLVAFKAAGIDIAEGANALKSINFKAIAASPTARNSFLRITGQDMTELIEKHNAEFLPMMNEIADIIQTLDQPAKMDLISRVFGIHQGNRAITLLNQLTTGSEAMARATEIGLMDAVELAALANKEIGDIQESAGTRFKRMVEGIKASLEPLGISVLEALLPIGEMVNKLINWISELPEGVKKTAINISLLLAAVGPMVMLAGLFGNLLGMFGRMIGWVAGLAVKFQILNADTKAATLIQKALETETDRATNALNEERIALGNLAKALDGVNRSLREQLGLTDQIATSNYGPVLGADGKPVRTMLALEPLPKKDPFVAGPGGIATPHQARINNLTRREYMAAWDEAIIENNNRKIAAHNKLVEESKRKWMNVGASISAASAAASGFAMLTGNQVVANVSALAMVASAVAPAMGTVSKRIGESFLKAQASAGELGKVIGDRLKRAAEVGKNAFASMLHFITGPWGLAIGGVLMGVIYLWDQHRKQVAETQKMYEKLTDSAELLGKTYDFQPVSRLQRAQDDPDYDPNTIAGQKDRIEDMKETNKELYDLLQQRSEHIRKNYEGTARDTEALNEAMRQGALVLKQTGDPEKAKQVAWDVYNIISGEMMTFDAFKLTADVTVNLDTSQMAADKLAADLEARLAQVDLTWRGNLVDEESIQAGVKSLLGAIEEIPDPLQRNEMIAENFGQLIKLQEVYFQGQKDGWIDSNTTFTEFATNIEDFYYSDKRPEGAFVGVSHEDIKIAQAMAEAINEYSPSSLLAVSEASTTLSHSLSGLNAAYKENLNIVEISRLQDELRATTNYKEQAAILAKIAALQALAYQETVTAAEAERSALATEKVTEAAAKGLSALEFLASGGTSGNPFDPLVSGTDDATAAMNGYEDSIEDAKSALDSLTAPERQLYDAYKTSMEELQKATVDAARTEFQGIQDSQRRAFDAEHEGYMDDVEALHDGIEKTAEVEAERRQKVMEQRHRAQKKELDAEKKAAMEAMDARRDALGEREKSESKALGERYKNLEKQLKDSQDARRKSLEENYERQRKQVEETYDAQIEAINKQIETEERLEEHRQRMYEKERERFSRLQQMYSQNIDLNMAVNTGDLDEAARIASSMASQQSDWATQDLSEISQDASESRRDKMGKRIDALEERKQKELDDIKEVEEAALESLKLREEKELESLKKREDAEKAALEAKYKRLEDELAAEREMLEESFANRSEALSDRQAAEKDSLSKTLAAEREQRQTNREEAKAAQQQKTADARVELDQQLADSKKTFDGIADHWSGMTAQNFDEWVKNNGAMLDDIERMLGIELRGVDADEAKKLWRQRHTTQERELDLMANADAWKDAARIIVDGITSGILGITFNAKEFSEFARTGKMPKNFSSGSGDKLSRGVYHSGGIAGVTPGKATGPGFTGKHQEIDATLLKGEGVLNLRAMGTPGVPQMLDALNKGYTNKSPIASHAQKIKSGNSGNRPGGAGGLGMLPAIAGITVGIVKQFTRLAALAGIETGLGKAEQATSGVNIKLGKNQAMGMDAEQLSNASAIISTGRRLGASERDIVTALMTAMQESSMRNLNYGDDIHGVRNPDGSLTSSLGLFQQQKWWGTRGERLDPNKSSELFYKALFKVNDRDRMPLTLAAQSVQRSAYPNAYAKWEPLARVLLGGAALGDNKVSSHLSTNDRLKALKKRWEEYEESQKGFMYPTTGMVSWLYGWRNMAAMGRRDFHNAIDIRSPGGTPVYATHAGTARTGWDTYGGGNYVSVVGPGGITTGYYHLSKKVARTGQRIERGTLIGNIGNTGRLSFGNHLHFSVSKDGRFVDPAPFMNEKPYIGKYVSPQGIGMRNGGLVYGNGIGDKEHRLLEPGEFVMRKNVVDGNRALFSAINNGALNIKQGREGIDNSRSNLYNVEVNFNGPVNKEIDIQRAVEAALHAAEKKKSHSRSVNNR